jgi:structural maintenance of chromosomes protein 5
MLFMLSLQQLTVVPFRVVDEINQGMDANYERAVFQRICEESSKARPRSAS